MELRLLAIESERRTFAKRLTEARARSGGFREKPRSRLARIQLEFADLYGLFGERGAPAEEMIAGFGMHDLEAFPQSCTRPDLSHLPAWSVMECSDLWSLSWGAGMVAWCASAAPLVLAKARAVLVYLAVRPFDGTAFYRRTGFVEVAEPFIYPYLETARGAPIWAQAMLLEGAALQRMVLEGAAVREAIDSLSSADLEDADNPGMAWLRHACRRRPRLRPPPSQGTTAVAPRLATTSATIGWRS